MADENPLQEQLNSLKIFTTQNLMKIKEKKTTIIKFNFSRTNDFPPELQIEGFEKQLQVVNQTKLLGIMLTSDLRWGQNTEYICTKAYKKMWTLRRMKALDIDPLLILDVYLKEVRSVLELAVPAWHSGLTLKQSSDIERVQRVALFIILSDISSGRSPYDYDMSLVILDLEPLYVRREKLCLTFAKKTVNSRHSDMFQTGTHVYDTRMAKPTYKEHNSNTQRCFKSPLNYLTRLLNEDRSK